jgi:alpha-tubulin suppressor-like RCC1 family protein
VTTVPVAAQSGVTAIAAGDGHMVALKDDGTLVAWGTMETAKQPELPASTTLLCRGKPSDDQWPHLERTASHSAGVYHTVALKQDGSVVEWGNIGEYQATPVAASSSVTAIAAGYGFTVALKNDGSVVAWGQNGHGETTVPVTAQSGVAAIAAGMTQVLALKTDGSVVTWEDEVTDYMIRARPFRRTWKG